MGREDLSQPGPAAGEQVRALGVLGEDGVDAVQRRQVPDLQPHPARGRQVLAVIAGLPAWIVPCVRGAPIARRP